MKVKTVFAFWDKAEKLNRYIGDVFEVTEERYAEIQAGYPKPLVEPVKEPKAEAKKPAKKAKAE